MRTRRHRGSKAGETRKKGRTFHGEDFSSGQGMISTAWGPTQWHVMHTISFNYPVHPTEADKKHYRDYILNLRHILPCKYCRINLRNNFKRKPLLMSHMKNRDTFSRYVYELHELVNKMLGKKSHLSYCDVRERYENLRARCTQEKPKIFKFVKDGTRKKKEKGCTEPLYGKKSKVVMNIVPVEDKRATFSINSKCIKRRGTMKMRTK